MTISMLGITYRFVYLTLFYTGLFLLSLGSLRISIVNSILFNKMQYAHFYVLGIAYCFVYLKLFFIDLFLLSLSSLRNSIMNRILFNKEIL